MIRTAVVCLLACIVGACTSGPSDTLTLALRYSPTPPSVGLARLLVELTDSLGAPVAGASLAVHGHPTNRSTSVPSVGAQAQESGQGVYVIDGFQFDVAGSWILSVEARMVDGLEITRTFETPVYPGPDEVR